MDFRRYKSWIIGWFILTLILNVLNYLFLILVYCKRTYDWKFLAYLSPCSASYQNFAMTYFVVFGIVSFILILVIYLIVTKWKR